MAAASWREAANVGATVDRPTHAFTVDEFRDAHRISKARYYELKLEGLAPDRNDRRPTPHHLPRSRRRAVRL
jgi:hypothetical protein